MFHRWQSARMWRGKNSWNGYDIAELSSSHSPNTVNVFVSGCVPLYVRTCNTLATCPWSSPLRAQCQLGLAPASEWPSKRKRCRFEILKQFPNPIIATSVQINTIATFQRQLMGHLWNCDSLCFSCLYWQSSIFTLTRGIADKKRLQIKKSLLTNPVPFESMWWNIRFPLFQCVTSNVFLPDNPLSRAEYLHSKMI